MKETKTRPTDVTVEDWSETTEWSLENQGKNPLPTAHALMYDYVIPWLSRGYRIYQENKEQE
jgi:hypothetical protein